jgi:single-strand DNA-binding protein
MEDQSMSNDTVITIVGNLTGDPELRYTPSGAAVASFTIASTPRRFERETNQWKDGDPLFLRASIWRGYAENVAESLTKGMAVIATGRLKQRSYEDREGVKRTIVELEVEDIGPALRFANGKVAKTSRSNSQGQSDGGVRRSNGTGTDNPWSAAGTSAADATGWGVDHGDQPPF